MQSSAPEAGTFNNGYNMGGLEQRLFLIGIFLIGIAILNDLRNYCRGNPPVVAPIDRG